MKLPGRGVTNLDCPSPHATWELCLSWLALDVYPDMPSSRSRPLCCLPAQGRAPVRFQNRGQAVPPASRTPHHSVLRLVRATLDRVLDQHGHVYTDESLLQNIGTRWRKGNSWLFFARLVGHEFLKLPNLASKLRSTSWLARCCLVLGFRNNVWNTWRGVWNFLFMIHVLRTITVITPRLTIWNLRWNGEKGTPNFCWIFRKIQQKFGVPFSP